MCVCVMYASNFSTPIYIRSIYHTERAYSSPSNNHILVNLFEIWSLAVQFVKQLWMKRVDVMYATRMQMSYEWMTENVLASSAGRPFELVD